MKGDYLLEIQQRHNLGHFPLKFAHDIDLHSLLNPLYVLGGGGGLLNVVKNSPRQMPNTNNDQYNKKN